jgi:hypothetical protein
MMGPHGKEHNCHLASLGNQDQHFNVARTLGKVQGPLMQFTLLIL